MPYSTQADVQTAVGGAKRLTALVDWDGDAAVDSPEVTKAISAADAFINSFSGRRYTVPLSPVPTRCAQLSADLAAWYLKKWRGVLDATDMSWHEGEVKWLGMLAEGKVTWDSDPEPTKASRVRDGVQDRPATKEVSRAATKGFW